jgi:hypothetical protein
VHTGTINEPGPYYGFGSDLEEFGILGAIGAGIYQLIKKYNCHSPNCWRIGRLPAADGQFLLCYRHHPDYQGVKPTRELIERLHREHLERQAALHAKLDEIQHLLAKPPAAQAAANHQAEQGLNDGIRSAPLDIHLAGCFLHGGIDKHLLERAGQVTVPYQARRGGQRMAPTATK